MTTDWSLTAMLAALGGLVLVGVLAQGWWSARRAGPRRPLPPVPAPDRQEPSLGGAAGLSPDGGDGRGGLSPDGGELPDLRTLDESVPAVARVRRASTRIDALIDAIATLTPESPISGEMALSHMPGSRRAGTKPFHIEGLNAASGDWELPHAGQRYSEFQAGLQMANRSGALNEIEYSEFVQKVQGFADGIGAMVEFPDMLDVVGRARELDQFAGGHDAQLAICLRARGAAWTLGFVQQGALRHGFVPGSMPGRLVMPGQEDGAPPVLTLNFDAQAALADDPQASSLRELTLALDVLQTPEALEPFAVWQEAARNLARDFEADVCDDRGQVLNLHAFQSIGLELATLYKALASRDLAAGSPVARRLFS
ncbi:cell division protein FtsZ [Roseateles amylovorans]|uniref:Cell division protein FtsZ n=1 Tax=Roseateles amylovorans TaxID=2978473 RepID=A0ABY6B5D8_9BURK|nr:cell division protein FtsZ [Roseateles amylovorans]UXH80262.1 cell division protein FtsZ [Roseateles amylovorans]